MTRFPGSNSAYRKNGQGPESRDLVRQGVSTGECAAVIGILARMAANLETSVS